MLALAVEKMVYFHIFIWVYLGLSAFLSDKGGNDKLEYSNKIADYYSYLGSLSACITQQNTAMNLNVFHLFKK